MSAKYWVGGGSTDNIDAVAPTNWSNTDGGANNATAPTSSDDVFYTNNSGVGNSIWDVSFNWRSINCTGFTGKIVHNAGVNASIGDATAGASNIALKFVAGMTYQLIHPQTSKILFISTSATQQTIDWGGKTYGNTEYNASSNGSWLWNDAHISSIFGLNATLTLTKGTLNTNGKSYTGGQVTGSNSNVRTLTMGASQFYLYGVGNNCWLFATVTNLTVTANTAKAYLYRSLTNFAPLIQSGTKDWGGLNIEYFGGGIATIASGGVPIFNDFKVNGGVDLGDGREDRLQQNNSWTSTGAVVFNGLNSSRRLRIHSNGGTRTITVAGGSSVTGKYVDFQNTSLSISNNLASIIGGAGDLTGNTNIVFTGGITKYFYAPTAGIKSYNDSQYWFSGSGGTGSNVSAPLPQDDVRFDANSFPVTGITVRNGVGAYQLGRNINWTGVTNNPTWDFQVDVINYGSLTLASGMSVTSYTNAFFTMFGSGTSQFFTVDFAGIQMPHTLFLINFASTNTCTLQSHFVGNSANTTLFQTTGLIDFNNKNITTGRFAQSSGTITMGSGIFTLKGIGTVWNCAGTVNSNTSEIIIDSQNATAKTFTGGSKVYNKLTLQGNYNDTITFSGNNTFGNTSITKTSAFNLIFTTGSTTTFSGTVTKTTGSLWNLMSTTTTAFTWSKSSGSVTFVDAIISKSTASGGATFTANTNSINGGGNTGWTGFVTPSFMWTGAVDSDMSRGGNWFGGVAPSTNDVAIFSGLYNINATITDVFAPLANFKGMQILQGYTGVVTKILGTWELGSEGLVIDGGTLTLPNTFTNNGKFRMTGGTFTAPSISWTQVSQGSTVETIFVNNGTYSHNSGSVIITGSSDAILTNTSARQFYNLSTSSFTGKLSGTFFADNSMTLQSQEFNGDATVKVAFTSGSLTGTGIIRITGTNLTLNATAVYNLQFNCTGTVTLSADCIVNNTLTLTAVATCNGNTIRCKGNISTAIASATGTTNTSIEGTSTTQSISGAGVLIGDCDMNKPLGITIFSSHMALMNTGKNFSITSGQLNTNDYNIVFANNLTVNEASGGFYFETLGTSTTVNGTLTGRKIQRQKLNVGVMTI
jgi:hypothetical protein